MSALGSYLLYYFIIISSSIIAWFSEYFRKSKNNKVAKWFFYSALIIPVLISGFRYGVGTDYDAYVKIYHNLYYQYPGILSAITDSRFEPGWVILNYIVRYIFDDVKYLFIVTALITWICGFKAIYDNKDRISIGIATLILFCTLYNMSFNIMRQILSITIIMLSIKPMVEKKKWKFLLTVLFASSFHFTSLAFLPAYWIVNSKTENRESLKRIIIPLLFIGLVIFFPPIFYFVSTRFDFLSSYSIYSVGFIGFSISEFLLKLPIILLISINVKKLKLHNNLMYKLSFLFFIGVILTFLSSYSTYINRLPLFFDVTQVFIVSAIIKVQTNKHEKFLYAFIVVIYYLARFTFSYLIMGNAETIPYRYY